MDVANFLLVALLVLFFVSVIVFQILSHKPRISKYLSDSINSVSTEDFSPDSLASPATEDSGTSSCASDDSFPPTRLFSPSGNNEIHVQIWPENERRDWEHDFDKEVEEKLKMGELDKASPKMPLMSSPRLPLSEQDYTIFCELPTIKLFPAMVKNTKAKPQKNGEEVEDMWAWSQPRFMQRW